MHLRLAMLFLAATIAAPVTLRADSFTYTYAGLAFTSASGVYATTPPATPDSVTGSFTLSSPLLDDLTALTPITPTSFSFTDGVNTIDNASYDLYASFEVKTDSSGDPTAWYISLQDDPGGYAGMYNDIFTSNYGDSAVDHEYSYTYQVPYYYGCGYEDEYQCVTYNTYVGYANYGQGGNNVGGSFALPSLTSDIASTPEPASLALVATGIFAAAGMMWLRLRRWAVGTQSVNGGLLNRLTIPLVACFCILLPGALRADTITVFENTTGAVPSADRTATFSSMASQGQYSPYTEDGLSFSVPGAYFVADLGFALAPGGFSGQSLYPNGGSPNPLTISTTDNATLYGIQFNLGSGYGIEQFTGDELPIAYELLSGANVVGSGSLDALQTSSGYLLGFSDPSGFTSLVITNCQYDPCSISDYNAIAIDNVSADLTAPVSLVSSSTPEPASLTLLATGLVAAAGLARLRGRQSIA